MNDNVIEAVTVDITDCGPAACVLINDYMLEIHCTGGVAEEEKKGGCHYDE
jgi:hypothetical protein